MIFRILKLSTILAIGILIGGCFVYKADVQQGNEITQSMVEQLELGMTKREVSRILGFPLINDPFHKDRWDYFYSKKNGKTGKVEQQLASLKFEGDKLSEFTSSFD